MEQRIQIVAIVLTAGLFVVVFELVRRKRLMERYALLWMFLTIVLFAVAVWRDLLIEIAAAIGIFYAPSALFAIALGGTFVMLLLFSLVISRLVDQTQVLAPRLSILQQRVDELESRESAEAARGELVGQR